MGNVSTEITRKVWHDKEGVCICISPDSDSLGLVRIFTGDKESKDWFGDFDFAVTPEIAEHLGRAIIQASKEADNGTTD